MTNDKQARILASSLENPLEEIGGKNSKDFENVGFKEIYIRYAKKI